MSKIVDENGILIASEVEYATTFWTRYKGLMLRKQSDFPKEKALLFNQCNSIHMFFMRFPIDVIYLDRDFNVVKIVRNIKPWQVDFGHPKAYYTIELNAGVIKENYEPHKIFVE